MIGADHLESRVGDALVNGAADVPGGDGVEVPLEHDMPVLRNLASVELPRDLGRDSRQRPQPRLLLSIEHAQPRPRARLERLREVCMVPGHKAGTKTPIPAIERFLAAHPAVTDLVVVTDAGLLSASNLNALEDDHLHFVVGSGNSGLPTTWQTTRPRYFRCSKRTGQAQIDDRLSVSVALADMRERHVGV